MMAAKSESGSGFSDFEKQAMKERAAELRAEAKAAKGAAKAQVDLDALLGKIKEMPEPDRSLAMRIHEIVLSAAPQLYPKTWYSMPAWANAEGKVVCFFQSAAKFKARYATFGFNDAAALDDGNMWPTAFALTKLTGEDEARIAALVKKAAG